MAELLLRLFQSDFFTPALGVSYLRFYADSVGITWHLIHLLRTRFPAADLAFYWPQLCHLLLSTPHSESLALETYILDIAAADPHTALITSWSFQAALRDLAGQPNTPAFRICQRILNHCHHILFHTPDLDHFLLASAAESAQHAQTQQARQRKELLDREAHSRLLQQLGASSSDSDVALSLPATAPSSSATASAAAKAALSHQQRPFLSAPSTPPEPSGSSASASSTPKGLPYLRPATSTFLSQQLPSSLLPALLRRSARPKVLPSNALTTVVGAGAILASVPGQPLLTRETAMVAVLQGMKAHDRFQVPTRLTDEGDEVFSENDDVDPNLGPDGRLPLFGIQRPPPPKNPNAVPGPPQPPPTPLAAAVAPRRSNHAPASASASSIFLPGSASHPHRGAHQHINGRGGRPAINLAALPKAYLSSLLRTHYFRAQTRMLQHLQDISTRLLAFPKLERLAALRTELTSLNHTLPADVCLPLWCECGPDSSTTAAVARAELNANAAVAAAAAADNDAYAYTSSALGSSRTYDESRSRHLDSGVDLGRDGGTAGSKTRGAAARHSDGVAAAPTAFLSEHVAKPPVRHHRIVRIDPAEAVVLNSADRAPYLLHIEVLRNDLDFDPDRRGNRELCERLVRGEQEGRARREQRWRESSGDQSVTGAEGADASNATWSGRAASGRLSSTSGASGHAGSSRHPSSSSMSAVALSDGRASAVPADKALPSLPPPSKLSKGSDGSSAGSGRDAGSIQPAGGVNPMSEPGAGPSPALADPEGPLETMFADLAMGDVGQRGNEEALAAAAASLAATSDGRGSVDAGTSVHDDDEDGTKAKKSMAGEDLATVMRAVNKDDPSAAIFRESWESKKARIRKASPYGHLPEWDVFSMIVKTGADLRQEQLAVQLIHEFGRIWASTGSACWVRYFRILVTGDESGLMETITDAVSVHSIKKEAYSRRLVAGTEGAATAAAATAGGAGSTSHAGGSTTGQGAAGAGATASLSTSATAAAGSSAHASASTSGERPAQPAQPAPAPAPAAPGRMQTYSLFEHFQETFGEPDSARYREAQNNFIESLAGYSIVCYLLQIKDRHNGNILIDHQGHIIHIDFGFMLGLSPGGVGFEAAPFKFPQEYIDILGGAGSEAYEKFKALMRSGFRDVRKNAERVIMIVELMQKESKLPCFALNEQCATQLRDRFQLGLSQAQCDEFVDRLVLTSAGSVYTRLYDRYQSFTQGIL